MIFFFCNICFSSALLMEKLNNLSELIFNPRDIFVQLLFKSGFEKEIGNDILGITINGNIVRSLPKKCHLFNYTPDFVLKNLENVIGVIYTDLTDEIYKKIILRASLRDVDYLSINSYNILFDVFDTFENSTLYLKSNIVTYENDVILVNEKVATDYDVNLKFSYVIDTVQYPFDLATRLNKIYIRNCLIIAHNLPTKKILYPIGLSDRTFLTILEIISREKKLTEYIAKNSSIITPVVFNSKLYNVPPFRKYMGYYNEGCTVRNLYGQIQDSIFE